MIIDTHCHYNMDPLYQEWSKHWQTAQEHGVSHSLVVGTNAETSQRAVEIAATEEKLFAAIGLHPYEYIENQNVSESQGAVSKLVATEKVIAVGETGLDYYRLEGDREAVVQRQQDGFRWHVQLAQKHQLPLLLHVRDKGEEAYWDTLRILKEENWSSGFILHCVSGPQKYIHEAVEMGAYISLAGNITYPSAAELREIVRSVPQERILIETDAPFLAPQEFRGQTCEPWMISKTAEFVEKELNLSQDQLSQNTRKLFQNSHL